MKQLLRKFTHRIIVVTIGFGVFCLFPMIHANATPELKIKIINSGESESGDFDSFRVSYSNNLINPVFNVYFNSEVDALFYLKLHDMTGNEIKSIKVQARKGDNIFNVDVSSMNKGVYFVALQSKNKTRTQRVVIN